MHSQGRVKLPTGGKYFDISPRALTYLSKVSRFGENPKPTVIVWMKENRARYYTYRCCFSIYLIEKILLSSALILVSINLFKGVYYESVIIISVWYI